MDRKVLLRLYQATGGGSWKHQDGWAENAADLGSWYGVTTNAEGRVVKLELGEGKGRESGNNLVGENSRAGSEKTLPLTHLCQLWACPSPVYDIYELGCAQ